MTTSPKTIAEICQEGIKEQEQKLPMYVVCDYSFNAGFWLRDKLGNEALKVAKEVMSTYDDQAVYKCQLEIQKLNEALNLAVEALEEWKSMNLSSVPNKALAEIRKLMGDDK